MLKFPLASISAALFFVLTGCSSSKSPPPPPPLPVAATPTFSPVGGTYSAGQLVSLSTTTQGAKVYYSTDGTTPTVSSTLYASQIAVAGPTETIKAIAVASGYTNSAVGTATYTAPVLPAPTFSPVGGSYSPGLMVSLSDAATGAMIYYSLDGTTPTAGSTLYVGPIYVLGPTETINAIAVASGDTSSAVATATYTVPLPSFSPPGGTYTSAQLVSICCSDYRFSFIGYTIQGSAPSSSPTGGTYNDPIVVSTSETIQATIVYANGPSLVGTATYTITSLANRFLYSIAGDRVVGYSGDGGDPIQANFRAPSAVALDGAGNLYIADPGNNAIREISATTGLITTIAGNIHAGYSGDGGMATAAKLSAPSDVAVDRSGNIYIADSGNNVIRRISASSGLISTIAGTGKAGFTGDGASAIAAELNGPTGVAVDAAGNLFIADHSNLVVREVLAASGLIKTVAGGGSGGDGGLATAAALTAANRVALDGAGNLYVSCQNTIEMISAKTGIIQAFAGLNPPPYSMYFFPFLGDGGPATSGFLEGPQAIAFDASGNLYIADGNDSRIREVSAADGTITTVAGSGSAGAIGDGGPGTNAELNYPAGITLDNEGDIYIADTGNSLVRKLLKFANPPTSSASNPVMSPAGGAFSSAPVVTLTDSTPGAAIYYTYDGSTPTTASPMYNGPISVPITETLRAIAVAPNYLVSGETDGAFTLTAAGSIISRVAGVGPGGYNGGNPIYAVNDLLQKPNSVVTDSNGNFYFGDEAIYRDSEVTAATGMISSVVGNGLQGSSGNGGLAIDASLGTATYLGMDSANNLYIADSSNEMVRKVIAKTGVIQLVAGNGTAGYGGDGGNAQSAELNGPMGVALDPAGNVYIADSGNNVIREVSATTGLISTVAGSTHSGYSGDGGPAKSATFNQPVSIAIDSKGDVFVADYLNCVVRKIIAVTGNITTVAGTGACGVGGDGSLAVNAELGGPTSLALDAAGNLFIADPNNNVIREVNASSGIIETIAGNGTVGSGGDGGLSTRAQLYSPQGIAIDPMGNLYIADFYNMEIREVTNPGIGSFATPLDK